MKKGLLFAICLILLSSCKKDESIEKTNQLKAKFHGKYEIISCFSVDPVDLNMDGITSTNLLAENPEIEKSSVEILFPEHYEPIYSEFWPVEYINSTNNDPVDPNNYHPSYCIIYGLYANAGRCSFENDKSITFLDEIEQNSTNTLLSIDAITTEESEIIKVIATRKLYTMKGWVTTKTESLYKRYTTTT